MRVPAGLASILVALASFVVATLAVSVPAQAARVALVIGNNDYRNLGAVQQLAKAVNDANAVGDALEKLGFTVMRGENLDRSGMVDRIFAFTQAIRPGDTAAFFYAGHGVAIGGANFLLPADVPEIDPGQEARLRNMAIGEADIVADIQERKAKVTLMILDACRDNPFRKPGVTRSVGAARGLTRVAEAQGVFAIYSAGFGQSALDGLGGADRSPNSVFTRALVPELAAPRKHLADMVIDVRQEVAALARSVGHEQSPAYYDQTQGGRIYLGAPPAAASADTPAPKAKPATPAGTLPRQDTAFVIAPPVPATPPADRRGSIGRVWHTEEGTAGWWGTWTRRGTSDTFDAINFDPTRAYFDISVAEMAITGDDIHIVRRAPRVACIYRGRLAADGLSASGTYGCNNINRAFPWSATISNALPEGPRDDWRGQVWSIVEDDGWRATVKRRGMSEIFDAVWRHPAGGTDMAAMLIRIDGDAVTILRDQEKGRCTYRGALRPDRQSLSGTYRCDWAPGRDFPWRATIEN